MPPSPSKNISPAASAIGMPVYSEESYQKALDFVKKEGLQLSVHCMGARAIDRIKEGA